MIRRSFLFGVLIFVAGIAGGCSAQTTITKASYLNEALSVECVHTHTSQSPDSIAFRFYEKGTYEISFSITPGQHDIDDELPQNFTKVVEAVPHETIVPQGYQKLPRLRITITKDGKSEFHDFS